MVNLGLSHCDRVDIVIPLEDKWTRQAKHGRDEGYPLQIPDLELHVAARHQLHSRDVANEHDLNALPDSFQVGWLPHSQSKLIVLGAQQVEQTLEEAVPSDEEVPNVDSEHA